MANMVEHLVEVRRIERIDNEKVRLTLIPVQDPAQPRPWGEHYIDVPLADEVPTGTQFKVQYSLAEV